MFAPAFPIETERLLLRAFTEGDFEALYAIESHVDVHRWLYTEPRTPAEVRDRLRSRIAETALRDEGDALSVACVRKDTGELIGGCMLFWKSREHRLGEIGFVFHPHHHGQGFATEAARPLIDFGFGVCGLHRIVGRLEARNAASARVLEKLGMRREALLIENEWVKGEWQSELAYAVLDRDWRALRDGERLPSREG